MSEWVRCPICGEDDMEFEQDKDADPGVGYIHCTNAGCRSNIPIPREERHEDDPIRKGDTVIAKGVRGPFMLVNSIAAATRGQDTFWFATLRWFDDTSRLQKGVLDLDLLERVDG